MIAFPPSVPIHRPAATADVAAAPHAIAAPTGRDDRGETAERIDPPPPAGDAKRLSDGIQAEDGRRGALPPRDPDVGPDSPAGPPPTFKITILERERLRAAEPSTDAPEDPAADADTAPDGAAEAVVPPPRTSHAAVTARAEDGFAQTRRVLNAPEPPARTPASAPSPSPDA